MHHIEPEHVSAAPQTVTMVLLLLLGLALGVALGLIFRFAIDRLARSRRERKSRETAAGEDGQFHCSLAEALKAQRTSRGMTQEQVAEAVGVSRQAVSKWENGTAEPSTSNLLALARFYGVDLNELLRDIISEPKDRK